MMRIIKEENGFIFAEGKMGCGMSMASVIIALEERKRTGRLIHFYSPEIDRALIEKRYAFLFDLELGED